MFANTLFRAFAKKKKYVPCIDTHCYIRVRAYEARVACEVRERPSPRRAGWQELPAARMVWYRDATSHESRLVWF